MTNERTKRAADEIADFASGFSAGRVDPIPQALALVAMALLAVAEQIGNLVEATAINTPRTPSHREGLKG